METVVGRVQLKSLLLNFLKIYISHLLFLRLDELLAFVYYFMLSLGINKIL